jgi:translation initiation factor 3 subunit I
VATIAAKSSVRTVNFSFSGNQAAYSTDKAMGHHCELYIIDVRHMDANLGDSNPIIKLPMTDSKITSMLWSLDETVITGHEDGHISTWDLRVSFFSQ